MKINIGGGHKRYQDFINLDIDPSTLPEHVVDLEVDVLPFEDSTVSEVKAYHILEHIGQGYFHLLQELYRVCKNGAIIDVQVPHHFHEVFINDPTHQRPVTIEGMRLFSKKYNKLEIERGGSSSNLGIRFDVDFELVEYNFIPDPFYQQIVKRNTEEQNVRLFRECVNVCQEVHFKMVVVK
jgi:ubiquinone/menaquinone biosynthesis C-methylase UbiE